MNYLTENFSSLLLSGKQKIIDMKKLLLIGTILLSNISFGQNINFPDATLKFHLVNDPVINTNMDNEISMAEAMAYTGPLTLVNLGISDFSGIEFFQNVPALNVVNNPITSLNLTGMNALMSLDCFDCDIASLTLPSPGQLAILYCQNNEITSLDISGNPGLTLLNCNDNNLTSLDLTSNPGLSVLFCNNNNITSIDLSSSTLLNAIECANNNLTSLDISNAATLVIGIFDDNSISSFTSANNQSIEGLGLNNNQLSSIDLSKMPNLRGVELDGNLLSSLDASANPNLTSFLCANNQLTSLNMANGNNSAIAGADFSASANPGLTCIEVSDPSYCSANWTSIDSGVSFDTMCTSTVGIVQMTSRDIQIYPNPAQDFIAVSSADDIQSIRVIDFTGRELLRTGESLVDISALKSGVYMIYVETTQAESMRRLLKR